MAKLFTEEELAELRKADEEIDEKFVLSPEDMARSRKLDREASWSRLDNRERRIAAQKAAYHEANREKWNAYQREYRRRKREEKRSPLMCAT